MSKKANKNIVTGKSNGCHNHSTWKTTFKFCSVLEIYLLYIPYVIYPANRKSFLKFIIKMFSKTNKQKNYKKKKKKKPTNQTNKQTKVKFKFYFAMPYCTWEPISSCLNVTKLKYVLKCFEIIFFQTFTSQSINSINCL